MYIGQIIQATVEKLVFQGKGLIRHQGWVVFVDDVAPGEEVVVKIVKKKKSFYIGVLQEIEKPSSHRVIPRCPTFGSCGGCQLQQLDYPEQVSVKTGWIQETLSHGTAAPIHVPVVPASRPWEYRRKVTLHFEWVNGRYILGYYSRDNRTLIDTHVCPIFINEKSTIFEEVRSYFSRLQGYKGLKGQVTLLKASDKFLVRFFFFPHIPHGAREALQAPDSWASIWLESPHQGIKVKENPFDITPHVFLQNFPEQAERLYNDVVAAIEPGRIVMDLYCGTGTLTKLLSNNAKSVIGVESNAEAIRLARDVNAAANIVYHIGTVESVLPGLLKKNNAQTIIINPPRIGLMPEVIPMLIESGADELIYISCDPSTLKRDLNLLGAHYRVERASGYDMFPQTTHLETVTYLRKNR